MNKVWIVAAREYRINIRRWSFWLFTLGLPMLIAFRVFIVLLIILWQGTSLTGGSDDGPPNKLGVVDQAGLLDWQALNHQDPASVSVDPDLQALLNELRLPTGLKKMIEQLATITSGGRLFPR